MLQITQMPVLQAFSNPSRYVLFPKNVVAIYCASQRVANVFTFSIAFQKCWNPTLCDLLSIPMSIYPPVKDTR